MIGDGVLDHLQQLLLRVGGANRESVQQLDHQPGKSLESTRNANAGVHFNQDTLGGVNEDLQFPGLVDGRVEESEKTLRP